MSSVIAAQKDGQEAVTSANMSLEPASHVSIRHSGPNHFGAPGRAMRARRRKMLRLYRDPVAEARSPPDQMACFSSPAPRWLLGSRTVVLLALLVIYNDINDLRYRYVGFECLTA